MWERKCGISSAETVRATDATTLGCYFTLGPPPLGRQANSLNEVTNSHAKFAQLKQLFGLFSSHGRKNTSLQLTDELVDVSSVLVTCVVAASVDDPSDVVVTPGEVVVSGTFNWKKNRRYSPDVHRD